MQSTYSPYMSPQREAYMQVPTARRNLFTLQNILKNLGLISILVFINKPGLPGNLIFFIVMMALCFKSPEWALKAFSLTMLTLITNNFFTTKSAIVWVPGRFLILFTCAFCFFNALSQSRQSLFQKTYYKCFLLFVFVTLMTIIMNNYYMSVSLLKLISFTVGVSAILAGTEAVRLKNSELTCWFYSVAAFTVFLGILAIALGQAYNGKGFVTSYFNGPFYHSNTLGPMSALITVYVMAVFMFAPYGYRWLSLGLILGMTYFAYLTQSRTALASIVIGGSALLFAAFTASASGRGQVRFNIPKAKIFLYAFAALVGVVIADVGTGGNLSSQAIEFINKGTSLDYGASGSGIDITQVLASREGIYDLAIHNFKQNPLTGIGFGTSTHPEFIANATMFSAPTEKGNLIYALLEEVGILGTGAFALFVMSFLIYLFLDANISGFAMFITYLSVNMGEMMFFSFGAHGAFGWILVGAGISLGDRCITRRGRVR